MSAPVQGHADADGTAAGSEPALVVRIERCAPFFASLGIRVGQPGVRLAVRILCIVDDFAWECPAPVADRSLSGIRVARELTTLIGLRGSPTWSSASSSWARHFSGFV
jgi:hypothetical protein